MTATHAHDWVAIYARPGGKWTRIGSACECGQIDRGITMPYDVGATVKSISKAYDISVASLRRAVLKGDLTPMATVDGEMVFAGEEVDAWLAGR